MARAFEWIGRLALALPLAVAGCDSTRDVEVIEVHGERIDVELFQAYLKRSTKSEVEGLNPKYRDQLAVSLARLQIAARNAEAVIDKQAVLDIQLRKLELLARAGAEKAGVFLTPSEQELRDSYNKYLQELPQKEFRIAHILVATRSDALNVIHRLNAGEKFGAIARIESVDSSRSRDGDLGWIRPETFPTGLLDLARGLSPGEYSTSPVHTAFGWHVIKLLESRPASAASYSQVKAQLSANILEARYQSFLKDTLPAK